MSNYKNNYNTSGVILLARGVTPVYYLPLFDKNNSKYLERRKDLCYLR